MEIKNNNTGTLDLPIAHRDCAATPAENSGPHWREKPGAVFDKRRGNAVSTAHVSGGAPTAVYLPLLISTPTS